jgi:hypothetical protein
LSQDGTALAAGSNITIVSDVDSQIALLATNDGSISSVDLQSQSEVAPITRLYTVPGLALSSIADSDPLLIHYDPTTRIVGVVKSGFTIQITRPLNGKPGKITRPINLHVASDAPMLALAKLSKKNKITSSISFAKEFDQQGGLSDLVMGTGSQVLISTYSGKLYSVGIGGELDDAELRFMGSLAPRVDRVAYYEDRTSIVAISGFSPDEDGLRIASPGSLVFGKLSDVGLNQPGLIVQALLPTASMLASSPVAIRRPCNIRR